MPQSNTNKILKVLVFIGSVFFVLSSVFVIWKNYPLISEYYFPSSPSNSPRFFTSDFSTPIILKNDDFIVYYVGAIDNQLEIFDLLIPTPTGSSYNSYLIHSLKEDTFILFETVHEDHYQQLHYRLKNVIPVGRMVDYLFMSHMEPDHSGSFALLMNSPFASFKHTQLIASNEGLEYLSRMHHFDLEDISSIAVSETKQWQELNLGGLEVNTRLTKYVHWPDTTTTYLKQLKTVVTGDFFGAHYCPQNAWDDVSLIIRTDNVIDDSEWVAAADLYAKVIFGHLPEAGLHVINVLNEIDDSIENVFDTHGPVTVGRDASKSLRELYSSILTPLPPAKRRNKDSFLVLYISSYSYTQEMALAVADGIKEVSNVELIDLSMPPNDLMNRVRTASGVLIGTPTFVGMPLPQIWNILTELNPVIDRGTYLGFFGSYGFDPKRCALPKLETYVKEILHVRLPLQSAGYQFRATSEELEDLKNWGRIFVELVNSNARDFQEFDSMFSRAIQQ
ncbi:FprA family A-type flavoprotein [Aduncisulcus paluster]|uniref:FprA family A-type flavoprotein n=1 Tax=Aduncisulcus paluster TaxID=2918883 RepID=A0ABQ5KWD7_9EUKA|nr:FprA family A-type flavoprotein [Aduncisulcus paluster]